MPTKYDTLRLIYLFKTKLSNFFFKRKIMTLAKKKKKKNLIACAVCDDTCIYNKGYILITQTQNLFTLDNDHAKVCKNTWLL